MAHTAHDDSFREIQLSGKQLVFLFMAVIVILVGVFLMGLQVGRGVLMARGAPGVEATAAANEAEPPPPPASASPSSTSSPATAGEKLSYAERLGAATPPKETLKPEASSAPAEAPSPKSEAPDPAPPTAAAKTPTSTPGATSTPAVASKAAPSSAKPLATVPAAKPAASAPAPAPAATSEPAGAGFAIQVAALREPDEADVIVKRLASKGYSAYVVAPAKGQPQVYRVRVGKFKERREADTVAAKLQKEEQFKPWIVR